MPIDVAVETVVVNPSAFTRCGVVDDTERIAIRLSAGDKVVHYQEVATSDLDTMNLEVAGRQVAIDSVAEDAGRGAGVGIEARRVDVRVAVLADRNDGVER